MISEGENYIASIYKKNHLDGKKVDTRTGSSYHIHLPPPPTNHLTPPPFPPTITYYKSTECIINTKQINNEHQ